MNLRLVYGLVAALAAPVAAQAAEAYVTYETFTGQTQISPQRWLFMERTRQSVGGALLLVQRDLGDQFSNSGVLPLNWSTSLVNPATILQMRSSMTVNDMAVTGCAQNAEASSVHARMIGSFFNTGPQVGGDRTNDVLALVRLTRASNTADAAGVVQVLGNVVRCLNADCSGAVEIIGTADMGTTTFGTTLSMRMEWEPASNRFNFYRANDPVIRISYAYGDALQPSLPFKNVQTRTQLANCVSGERSTGYVSAKFDNVAVNASALP